MIAMPFVEKYIHMPWERQRVLHRFLTIVWDKPGRYHAILRHLMEGHGLMGSRIAVIDDEPDIIHLVSIHLRKAGFSVDSFANGRSLLKYLEASTPDLVILDLMLPDLDGFDVCRAMKADPRHAEIPIIMLTARGQETDKVAGLELGADDYLTKPFSPKELVARVRAVLRRTIPENAALSIAGVTIDPERFEVTVGQKPVTLTPVEFRILHLLAQNQGKVFSRERILDHLWGNEKAVIDRTVDVHIKNLRDKLGPAGDLIKNIRGVGYKLQA
jgi:two-component system phosphate regulon response regulator PhoB/two-component system alkaline phosphatase synthesis response regulator PhoP